MISTHFTEISIRYQRTEKEKIQMHSPQDVYNAIKYLFDETMFYKETAYALFVDNAGKALSVIKIGEGSLSECYINRKAIGQAALLQNAAGVFIIHNHPSGVTRPSQNDIAITNVISNMLRELTDTKLIDHLIIAHDNFTSMKDEGII